MAVHKSDPRLVPQRVVGCDTKSVAGLSLALGCQPPDDTGNTLESCGGRTRTGPPNRGAKLTRAASSWFLSEGSHRVTHRETVSLASVPWPLAALWSRQGLPAMAAIYTCWGWGWAPGFQLCSGAAWWHVPQRFMCLHTGPGTLQHSPIWSWRLTTAPDSKVRSALPGWRYAQKGFPSF